MFGLFVGFICFSWSIPIDTSTAVPLELPELTVSARRMKLPIISIPGHTYIISKDQLTTLPLRTTPEFLVGMPGLFIQKTNHGGGSPFVRGLTGNQTLLMVDGIRLNNSTFRYGPNQYLNTIDPFSIDKYEVVLSGGSVAYGSDALGGTIQVFSKSPEYNKGWNGQLITRYMTQNMEYSGRAEIEYSNKKYAVSSSYGHRQFGDLLGGKLTGLQSPSGYQEDMSNFNLNIRLSSKDELKIANQYFIAHHVPIYHKIKLEDFKQNEISSQIRDLAYIKYLHATNKNVLQHLSITLAHHYTSESRLFTKNNSTTTTREKDKVFTKAFLIQGSGMYKKWKYTAGIDWYDDFINSERSILPSSEILRGLYPSQSTYYNYSIYAINHLSIARLSIDFGCRYNGFRINIKDKELGSVILSPQSFVPLLGLSKSWNKKWTSYIQYQKGFRAPNIDDMGTLGIVDFRYEIPAYNLQPEQASSIDVGIKYQSSHLKASMNIFRSNINDLITRIQIPNKKIDTYNVYQKENTEKAIINGGELVCNWQCNSVLNLAGQVSHTLGDNISSNEPLRRMPPTFGRFISTFNWKKISIAPELLWASKQTRLAKGDIADNRIGANGTAGWKVCNINTHYPFSNQFNASIILQNIFDQDYRMHGSGINGVGRSLLIQLSYQF